MRHAARLIIVLTAAASLSAGMHSAVGAGDCCCSHCGCENGCQKVCRLVCEEKKVDVICWGCKCEDFCVPGPGKPGCKHCEVVCESCAADCDCTKPHGQAKRFVWTDWTPSCAKIFTRKKLMQKIVTKKTPSYKWVVEDLCPQCETSCQAAIIEPGAQVPAPPSVDAKLIPSLSELALSATP